MLQNKKIVIFEMPERSIYGVVEIYDSKYDHVSAERGIRTPARLRVAVFETAAVPLGYLGIYYVIISIIKRIDRFNLCQYQIIHLGISF